ncbi:MAG: hypothetical protein H8E44_31600 [Planctomycetes bacterium]|nr:hypothetical protein [Planctomycetota bacterium]
MSASNQELPEYGEVARAVGRDIAIEHPLPGDCGCVLLDDTVAFCYPVDMSQPVKLSDELVLDARLTAEIAERSIAGQIEYWAQLGRAIEPLLQGAQALALRRAGAVKPLAECLETVDSPEGRRRVAEHLNSLPFPHYEPAADAPGMLVRIEADGTRTVGRFVNRQFKEAD